MKKVRVALFLITRDNDYQREQASVAEATAQRLGIGLQVLYAGGQVIVQMTQILAAIRAHPADRPDVVMVEPVGTGMPHVANAAAESGIGWVVLNRESDDLALLRRISSVPMGSVASDAVEVGRIQGRQFSALLPAGGTVLYVEGPSGDVASQRRAGLEQTCPANVVVKSVRGRWTEESAFQAVRSRLRLAGSRAPSVGIIGCQNDAMAMGARRAVEALTDARQRDQWLKLPFTGVDGLPSSGQAWVEDRQLAATVVTPALSGIALELVASALATGKQVPELTLTKPVSYPSLEDLRARAGRPALRLVRT